MQRQLKMRAELEQKFITSKYLSEDKSTKERKKMFFAKIAVILVISVLERVRSLPSSTASVASRWSKEPEYFWAMEHGFRLDATHHHIHFFDRGEITFYFNISTVTKF